MPTSAATLLPLPTRPDELSRAWLQAALRVQRPDCEVIDLQILEVIKGTSTKIRVAAHYRGRSAHDLPERLIIKGGFEDHSVHFGPMYVNEIRFYRDVAPHLPLPSPRSYFAASDPASHQSIVIMEDLTTRHVRFLSPLVPQTVAQVQRRLGVMARYHAATWNSPQFKAGGRFDWIGGRHDGWSVDYQERYLKPDVWSHYMALPRGAAVSTRLHDGERMRRALRRLGELHRADSFCLCHGDTHLGNLYEEADGSPGFFDAQVARGPWQLEVTYHLVGALNPEDRRRHERDLLAFYLDALRTEGIKDAPTVANAWDAHRREVAYGLFIFLINETRFQTESVNTAYTSRFGAAALDHDTFDLLAP